MTKIAVIYYSMYGHIKTLSDNIVKGVKEGAPDAQVDVFLVPETLPEEVLKKMHAGPKADLPTITPDKMKEYDGFVFGIPTRYGRATGQWSAFFDQTGGLWASGALRGKMVSIFSTTASQGGGQETTALTTLPFIVHHGMIYVPFGYGEFALQTSLDEPMGGSAYGAGGLAAGDGSRAISDKEATLANSHGKYFAETVNRYVKGSAKIAAEKAGAPAVVSTEGAANKEIPDSVIDDKNAEPFKTEAENKENAPVAAGAAVAGGTGAAAAAGASAQTNTAEEAPKEGSTQAAATQEKSAAAEEKPAAAEKKADTKEQKKGGLFSMCCGGSSQKKNFS